MHFGLIKVILIIIYKVWNNLHMNFTVCYTLTNEKLSWTKHKVHLVIPLKFGWMLFPALFVGKQTSRSLHDSRASLRSPATISPMWLSE